MLGIALRIDARSSVAALDPTAGVNVAVITIFLLLFVINSKQALSNIIMFSLDL